MSFPFTAGNTKLNSSNIVRQNISVPVISDIWLMSNLHKGSSNDGQNTINKTGFIFGETYKFEASITGYNSTKKKTELVWVIEYKSPATSKNSVFKYEWTKKGTSFELEITEKYRDLLGCNIKIKCYVKVRPDRVVIKKYYVHNAFRYFDGHSFNSQVNERMTNPWKIDQGASSLCGMACLYYILIQRDKNLYQKVAKELHRTGVFHFNNGYSIEPSTSMYEIKPTDKDYKSMKMNEADWIVLASTRSGESYVGYNGIEKGSIDQLGAVNWMDMLARMCKQVAGYSNVQRHNLGYIDVAQTIASHKIFDLHKLIEIDKKYKAGKKMVMMIQPNMIYNKQGTRAISEIHWVVYEGGLQLLDVHDKVLTTNLKETSKVTFKIYTWGEIRELRKVSLLNFESNYYGYIEA